MGHPLSYQRGQACCDVALLRNLKSECAAVLAWSHRLPDNCPVSMLAWNGKLSLGSNDVVNLSILYYPEEESYY